MVLIAIANRASGLHVAGVVGVSAAVSLVVAAVADFGTTPATLRDFAVTPPDRGAFARVLRLKLTLAILGAVVLAVVSEAVAPEDWAAALTIAALTVPLVAATSAATSKLVADGTAPRSASAQALGSLSAGWSSGR